MRDVPLAVGDNILEATAVDAAGNNITDTITVTRTDPTGDRLSIVDGNNQMGTVKASLQDPIQVLLSDENGDPIADRTLEFTVTRSDGRLDDGTDFMNPAITQQVATNASGIAQLFWILGSDAGCGNNRVEARDPVSGSAVYFCATAEHGAPVQLNLVTGNNQHGATGAMAPDRLRVRVSDGDNGVPGVMVDFMALTGGGEVNGDVVVSVETNASGIADVSWVLGDGAGEQMAVADFEGNTGAPVFFEARAVAPGEGVTTSLSGIVLDNAGLPVGGAPCELEVGGEAVPSVTTGEDGRFTFEDIPAGPGHLHVGGLEANRLGGAFLPAGSLPDLAVAVMVVASAENTLPSPVLLPMLDPDNARTYDGTQDVELTVEGLEGLRMIVRAGSMTRADGTVPSPSDPAILALNQVQTDAIPMPLPNGVATPFAWTLQPSEATFDPPVEIIYPNMAGLPAGTASFFLSFNHDTGAFEVVGTGTVSADGSEIRTDRGSGISVAGWGANCPPYSATGEVKSCEANLTALIKESARFLIAVFRDVNKLTKVIGCVSDIVFNAPTCIDAYRTFRDEGGTNEALSLAFNCAKGLKTVANNCASVALPIDPFKLASRAKLLSDALARALAFARANDCFVGPGGAQALKGIEALNNLINPLITIAEKADPKKAAIAAACAALANVADILELGVLSGQNKGGNPFTEEQLAELDAMYDELEVMLDELDDDNPEILADLEDPVLLAAMQDGMDAFEEATADLTPTELAGFTVMVSDQVTVADEFGFVDFGNITIPDEFGAGGPGTPPDFVGDDIVRMLGFKELETGTRYVVSTPFQIVASEAFVIEEASLTFSDTVPPFPQSVALNAASLAIPVGGTSQLALTGTFFNGDTVDVTTAADGTTYRVSNTAIVTISADGLITGAGEGTAYVTATNNGAAAVRRVTVAGSLISTTVQGVVRDFNGDPVAGATITTAFGGEVATDASGAFTLNLTLPEGTSGLTLIITVGTDTFTSGVLEVVDGGTVDAGTLTYTPSDLMTTVAGRVERADGSPVDGATVTTDQGGEGTTNSAGDFSFDVALTDTQSITVFARFTSETEDLSGASALLAPNVGGTTSAGTIRVTPVQQVLYPRRRIPVDFTPGDLAVADFDEDGNLDVITVNESPDTLSLALGNGDGSFNARTDILIGTDINQGIGLNPDAIVVADFNEDGHLDVATGNLFSNDIAFVPGNGDGTFGTPGRFATEFSPNSIAAADLDGDGHLDLLTPNATSDSVSVLLGNGDGTFADQVSYMTGDVPRFLRIADINGDGNLDVLTANAGQFGGSVSILLGNGDGTFANMVELTVGSDTDSLAVGDFNGDGELDIAANRAALQGDLVSIHHGTGDGAFSETPDFEMATASMSFLEAVDLDEDGDLDLLAATFSQPEGIVVLENQGDGTFENAFTLDGGQFPDRIVPADLNGDGSLDLAMVNTQSNDVSVFLAAGDGVFEDLSFPAGTDPEDIELVHLNDDGNLDALVLNDDRTSTPVYTVTLLQGNGDGTFQDGMQIVLEGMGFATTGGDLNEDGAGDVVVSRCCDGAVDVYLADGAGGFEAPADLTFTTNPAVLALEDLDGDGALDLVGAYQTPNEVVVLRGRDDGTFFDALAFTGAPGPHSLAFADMNGDTALDIVVGAFDGIYVLTGTGDGTFNEPTMASVSNAFAGAAVGDVDNDGVLDVVSVTLGLAQLAVALGNGDGTLATPVLTRITDSPQDVALADVNGDGAPDALVLYDIHNSVEVYTGLGDGTFEGPDVYGAGQSPRGLAVADLNGDGQPDLVTANEVGEDIRVLLHE